MYPQGIGRTDIRSNLREEGFAHGLRDNPSVKVAVTEVGGTCSHLGRQEMGGVGVTFLKKGILFSLEWGDVTLFALGLGERWFAGISFSSASKPVASMSIAIYRQTIQKSSGG